MGSDPREISRYCWRCSAPLRQAPPTSCARCGQQHYNNPKPAAESVVERNGSVLLVRRAHEPWRGYWDIPGGFCEPGEHPIQTAERELLEETGLRGQIVGLVGIWIDEYGAPHPDGMQETTLNITFLARLQDHVPAPSGDGEATETRWFPIDALPASLAFPGHAAPALDTARRIVQGRNHDAREGIPSAQDLNEPDAATGSDLHYFRRADR